MQNKIDFYIKRNKLKNGNKTEHFKEILFDLIFLNKSAWRNNYSRKFHKGNIIEMRIILFCVYNKKINRKRHT